MHSKTQTDIHEGNLSAVDAMSGSVCLNLSSAIVLCKAAYRPRLLWADDILTRFVAMKLTTSVLICCICHFAAVTALSLKDAVGAEQAWIQDVRRHLHQYPELLYEEEKTSQIIRSYLDEIGISYKCVLQSNS